MSLKKNHEPWDQWQHAFHNFKTWKIPGNLTSILIKIQRLENFYIIICYEFTMLKVGIQHRTGYLADKPNILWFCFGYLTIFWILKSQPDIRCFSDIWSIPTLCIHTYISSNLNAQTLFSQNKYSMHNNNKSMPFSYL